MVEKDSVMKRGKAQKRNDMMTKTRTLKASKNKLQGIIYVVRREDPRSPGLQRKSDCMWLGECRIITLCHQQEKVS